MCDSEQECVRACVCATAVRGRGNTRECLHILFIQHTFINSGVFFQIVCVCVCMLAWPY